jgi:hypothetical protein
MLSCHNTRLAERTESPFSVPVVGESLYFDPVRTWQVVDGKGGDAVDKY